MHRQGHISRFFQWVGDNPLKSLFLYVGFSVVLWTAQCSILNSILPLDVLETINWGAQWTMGHYKHPPLSGWIGYIFSCLFFHKDWAMYFLAQLCLAVGVFFTYRLAREFFDETKAVTSAILLYSVIYYTPSSMKYCSHFVEAAIQPAMAWMFYICLRDDKWRHWLFFGVLCALGVLGKYSVGMLMVAFVGCMIYSKVGRKRFLSCGPYLAFAIFMVLISPHLIWLAKHDFCCISHLEYRVEKHKNSPLYFLIVLACSLYPFVAESLALLVAHLEKFKIKWEKGRAVQWDAFWWGVMICMIPCMMLVLIALCGKDVVLMWMSSMVSWSGMVVVASLPFAMGRNEYRRLYAVILAFTLVVFVVTTVDLMINPRKKLHTRPETIVKMADDFWKKCYPDTEIPCLVGYRWIVHAVENYSPHRPPSADYLDPISVRRIAEISAAKGVLLIGEYNLLYDNFIRENYPEGIPEGNMANATFTYRTLFGPEKSATTTLIALPPR